MELQRAGYPSTQCLHSRQIWPRCHGGLFSGPSPLLDSDNTKISQTSSGGTLRTGAKIARCWWTCSAISSRFWASRTISASILSIWASKASIWSCPSEMMPRMNGVSESRGTSLLLSRWRGVSNGGDFGEAVMASGDAPHRQHTRTIFEVGKDSSEGTAFCLLRHVNRAGVLRSL